MPSGAFITIEGIEGMGKSTVIRAIESYLESIDQAFIITREPGGTPMAESIREVLLAHYDETVTPYTELLMMFAGRCQHVANVIKPALSQGTWVVSDRFTDASYAYQGCGRGMPIESIDALAEWSQDGVAPDVTLLLDAPVEVGLSRMQQRDEPDRIEREKAVFFEKVRECYLERAKAEPNRFVVIDANQTPDEVAAQAVRVIQSLREQRA